MMRDRYPIDKRREATNLLPYLKPARQGYADAQYMRLDRGRTLIRSICGKFIGGGADTEDMPTQHILCSTLLTYGGIK